MNKHSTSGILGLAAVAILAITSAFAARYATARESTSRAATSDVYTEVASVEVPSVEVANTTFTSEVGEPVLTFLAGGFVMSAYADHGCEFDNLACTTKTVACQPSYGQGAASASALHAGCCYCSGLINREKGCVAVAEGDVDWYDTEKAFAMNIRLQGVVDENSTCNVLADTRVEAYNNFDLELDFASSADYLIRARAFIIGKAAFGSDRASLVAECSAAITSDTVIDPRPCSLTTYSVYDWEGGLDVSEDSLPECTEEGAFSITSNWTNLGVVETNSTFNLGFKIKLRGRGFHSTGSAAITPCPGFQVLPPNGQCAPQGCEDQENGGSGFLVIGIQLDFVEQ